MRRSMLFVVAAIGLLGADAPKMDAERELAKFQGTWRLVSAETDGVRAPEERIRSVRVTISGKSHTVRIGDEVVANGVAFEVDPTTTPKKVTDTIGDGPDKGKTIQGIYKFEGDTLISCVVKVGAERPTKFTAKAGTGQTLRVFRRVKDLSPEAAKAVAVEQKRFEGTWSYESMLVAGNALPQGMLKEMRLILRDGRFEMVDARGTYRGIAEIDPTAKPRTIDIVFTEGLEPGKTVTGIYELDGDTYTLCSTSPGQPRPKELRSKAGTADSLTVLRRIKP